MSIDKNKLPPPRPMPVDPAVEVAMSSNLDDPIYGGLERRRRARNMTETQRKQAARDAQRTKVTYDLPPNLKQEIDSLARQLEAPPSHVVNILLHYGLSAIDQGKIDLRIYQVHSNIPRFKYFLQLESDDNATT